MNSGNSNDIEKKTFSTEEIKDAYDNYRQVYFVVILLNEMSRTKDNVENVLCKAAKRINLKSPRKSIEGQSRYLIASFAVLLGMKELIHKFKEEKRSAKCLANKIMENKKKCSTDNEGGFWLEIEENIRKEFQKEFSSQSDHKFIFRQTKGNEEEDLVEIDILKDKYAILLVIEVARNATAHGRIKFEEEKIKISNNHNHVEQELSISWQYYGKIIDSMFFEITKYLIYLGTWDDKKVLKEETSDSKH